MEAWRAPDGPAPGTKLLVCTDEGYVCVARWDGHAQQWYIEPLGASLASWGKVIAWMPAPEPPACIAVRTAKADALSAQISELLDRPYTDEELNS